MDKMTQTEKNGLERSLAPESAIAEPNELTETDELTDDDLDAVSGGGTCTTVTTYRRNGSIKLQSTTCTN